MDWELVELFDTGLKKTVECLLETRWSNRVLVSIYHGERPGLGKII